MLRRKNRVNNKRSGENTMPYTANHDIAEFKAGDTVPDSRAELWLSMFAVAPVTFVPAKADVTEASTAKPAAPSGKKKW